MFPALRKIKNQSEYFDILFLSIKNYSIVTILIFFENLNFNSYLENKGTFVREIKRCTCKNKNSEI